MASTISITTAGQVTPELKGVYRVGIGCKAIARRSTDGAIGIQILRGSGPTPESFVYVVRTKWYGPVLAGAQVLVQLGAMDIGLPDGDPRSYQMRVIADGGADLTLVEPFIATEPFAPAGTEP